MRVAKLDNQLLLNSFTFFNKLELVQVSKVSTRWHHISTNCMLWKNILNENETKLLNYHLFEAITKGNIGLVEYLCKIGANVNSRINKKIFLNLGFSENGMFTNLTPLALAIAHFHHGITLIKILLKYGANVSIEFEYYKQFLTGSPFRGNNNCHPTTIKKTATLYDLTNNKKIKSILKLVEFEVCLKKQYVEKSAINAIECAYAYDSVITRDYFFSIKEIQKPDFFYGYQNKFSFQLIQTHVFQNEILMDFLDKTIFSLNRSEECGIM